MESENGQLAEQLACEAAFFDVEGHAAWVFLPSGKGSAGDTPWLWVAPTISPDSPGLSHKWLFQRLLDGGLAVAGVDVGESHGSPAGRAVFSTFYDAVRADYGLAVRACLLPRSRGGLMLYNWAAENPLRVACIAGIYTVCDLRSYPGLDKACEVYGMTEDELAARLAEHNPVDRLGPLARACVPIFHVHGDLDETVPLEVNVGELARRYQQLGGSVELLVIRGKGHEMIPEFLECRPLVDFVIRHARPDAGPAG